MHVRCGCGEHDLWTYRDDVIHWRGQHWALECAFEAALSELRCLSASGGEDGIDEITQPVGAKERLKALAQYKRQLEQEMFDLILQAFPPGSRVYFFHGRYPQVGEVLGVAGLPGHERVRVRNVRTGKTRDVSLWEILQHNVVNSNGADGQWNTKSCVCLHERR